MDQLWVIYILQNGICFEAKQFVGATHSIDVNTDVNHVNTAWFNISLFIEKKVFINKVQVEKDGIMTRFGRID